MYQPYLQALDQDYCTGIMEVLGELVSENQIALMLGRRISHEMFHVLLGLEPRRVVALVLILRGPLKP